MKTPLAKVCDQFFARDMHQCIYSISTLKRCAKLTQLNLLSFAKLGTKLEWHISVDKSIKQNDKCLSLSRVTHKIAQYFIS